MWIRASFTGLCQTALFNLWAAGVSAQTAVPLKLNDISVLGTHNSYKQAMPARTMRKLLRVAPDEAQGLDYAHRPLSEQLNAGVRQLELDVYFDPDGGHYTLHSTDPTLRLPGFKVLHIPGVDSASSCVLLTQCLTLIRHWSDAHPHHLPMMLMFNAKEERLAERGGVDALLFTAAAWDALDAEIRSILPPRKLILPDEVQGSYPTLREAVLAGGWPTLDAARGRILFALDEDPDKVALYRGSRRSLEGRVFFINTDENSPAAAYLTLNDPLTDGARIARDVAVGFIVRTRADSGTVEARANDTRRRDAALASGAQYVSTDYIWPDARFSGGYRVTFPDGVLAVCNPVRRPKGCVAITEPDSHANAKPKQEQSEATYQK